MINEIILSELNDCYKEAIVSLANDNGQIKVEDTYEMAAQAAKGISRPLCSSISARNYSIIPS